jgi:L-serine kinase (ADP)
MKPRPANPAPTIELVAVDRLVHIEGFSRKRVEWLADKIREERVWTRPIAIDRAHPLVLDGQHRTEAARLLGLRRVPVVRFVYARVSVWSLRPNHEVDWRLVTRRALAGQPYPYKTVKHEFPTPVPDCHIPIEELR